MHKDRVRITEAATNELHKIILHLCCMYEVFPQAASPPHDPTRKMPNLPTSPNWQPVGRMGDYWES